MLAALDGDSACYRALLAELRTALVRYFARRLHNAASASAEDLVQDTLIAIHTRRLTFDPAQRVGAWVFAIARYRLIDLYRRNRIRATVPLDDEVHFSRDEEPATQARMDVETVLGTVPDRQSALIRRVRIDGATIGEAAAEAGMTETAAKVSIHRGLKALTARFSKEGGDER